MSLKVESERVVERSILNNMTNPKNGTSTPLSFKTSNLFSTSVTFDVWFVWNFWLPKWRIPISRQIPPGSGGIRFEAVLSFTQEPTTAFLKFTSVYVQLCWMEEKNVFVNIAWTVIYSYFQWVNLHHAKKVFISEDTRLSNIQSGCILLATC